MKYLITLLALTVSLHAQPTLANSDDITAAKARANHTGTQAHTTITGLGTAATADLATFPASSVYNVKAYNASGGGATTTTGSITSGTPTLTVASTTSFAVGQGIRINGAGAAGVFHVTTITAISGNTLTLAANAATTVASAAVHHDDTAAINTAIAACANAGGGTVFLPNGWYKCNAPLNASTNSVLTMPMFPGHESTRRAVRIIGEAPGKVDKGHTTIISGIGAVIDSSDIASATGSTPSVIAGAPWDASPGWTPPDDLDWNMVDLTLDNFSIFAAQGVLSGVNGYNVHGLHIGDTMRIYAKAPRPLLATNFPDYDLLAQGATFGIIFPAYLNTVMLTCGSSLIAGFGTGIQAGEHLVLRRPVVWVCTTALFIQEETYFQHLIHGSIAAESCKNIVVSDSNLAFFDLTIEYEGRSGTDFALTNGFLGNGANSEHGFIRYGGLNLSGYQYHPGAFPVSYGNGIIFHDLKNGALTIGGLDTTSQITTGDQQKLSLGSSYAASAGALNNIKLLIFEQWSGSTQYKAGFGTGPNGTEWMSTGTNDFRFYNATNAELARIEGAGGISIPKVGKTLSIKTGTNALAGTVTLTAGAGTIASTAIDTNTIIVLSLKTLGGTIADHPYVATITPGTGCTIAGGGASNTSVYNWVALKIN